MFKISSTSIEKYRNEIYHTPECGGIVTFEGRVRNHNEGNSVDSLEYESYESLALKEGEKIIIEAKKKFNILEAFSVHRIGHLQIGDLAIWILVTAKHRGEAFSACQYIIDEIKTRLPIWKKEHYLDKNNEPQWVFCAEDHHH